MEEKKILTYRNCPYLGKETDPESYNSYPSESNYCYHTKHGEPIRLGHQQKYCLTNSFPNCNEYAKDPGAALPGTINRSSERYLRKKVGVGFWVLGIFLLGLGFIATRFLIPHGNSIIRNLGGTEGIPGSTETVMDSTPTVQVPTPTPTFTPTLTPTFVDIKTPVPLHGLEIPLGINHEFLIHKIQAGESLSKFAYMYGTNSEDILAINYNLVLPLSIGSQVVIPLNFIDVHGLPAFEVYHVSEEISLQDLVKRLSVDLYEFKYYNALDDNFTPTTGDWFLVPRVPLPTPQKTP